MRISIIGTRGIPNHYGGFEQCAEYLATGLAKKGYEVTVYNSHNHPYQRSEWNGVNICHCYDPEYKMGTIGQFFYDLNCIRDLRKKKFDIVLQLGYTSSSVWGWLLPHNTVVTTNMDGMEWKRTKYSKKVQKFLMMAESLAVRFSDHLIADSTAIKTYLEGKYGRHTEYIPYGAEIFENSNPDVLAEYGLEQYGYDMLIARMEPENSIEMILDGVVKAGLTRPFLVVGGLKNKFAEYLQAKFSRYENIRFCGGIYDMDKLNNLRYYSNLYFHGHTVGGTNPSLLEAMASQSVICANDNQFNRAVVGDNALYFSSVDEVVNNLQQVDKKLGVYEGMLAANIIKIRNVYSCENIVNAYAAHFEAIALRPENKGALALDAGQISLVLENS
jgi:glycosyltransferase involved in cell wall biosynthesis